ncbi:MAG: hypothetical protein L3J49_13635 [Desulfobulbaceae bacterium]|nr:hypothetical protein [Desulfobulbaceae bacterium]
MKKVVILGGGFAGVEAAIFLRKKVYRNINQRPYFFLHLPHIHLGAYPGH